MAKLIIDGGRPLSGTITPSGAKNAALPIIAASLLTTETCTIDNLPAIGDMQVILEIIAKLGSSVKGLYTDHHIEITTETITNPTIDPFLARKLRSSILLLGPLLIRAKEIHIPYPGGCILGKRPIGPHFKLMEDFGATVTPTDEGFFVQGKHLHGGRIFLPEASVTVTENALMVASSIPETTIICNAACEPHVQNLADFLRSMGATITGDGTNTITITGKKTLHAGKITVIPDQIEIGTWALGAAITNGDLTIEGVIAQHLDIILYKFHEAGIRCHLEEGENQTKLIIQRTPREELRAINLTTNIWPGFPTDLQAPFTVLLTQANGVSLVHDWMYEGRLFYIDILSRMGANITLCDPHRAIVYGPTPLQGNKQIESPDLRAGMALVLAGLAAEGTTVIDNIELVDRGYENLDERLISLGASCRRVS